MIKKQKNKKTNCVTNVNVYGWFRMVGSGFKTFMAKGGAVQKVSLY